MKLKFFLTLLFAFCSITQMLAGLKWVDIGLNGLTCSMCSRSVEMSLRRLDFVQDVVMSLETTEGRIFFRSDVPINVNQIAKAVVNAGFSVRFLRLHLTFDDIPVNPDGSFVFQHQKFKWIDFQAHLNGPVALLIVEENFMSKKESAEWKKKLATFKSRDENILHVVQQG